MHFTPAEVELARQLHSAGLSWAPRPGCYVWDEHGLVEQGSPFHDRVYFILDLKHFVRRAGDEAAVRERFIWLLTYEDLCQALLSRGVQREYIAGLLRASRAVERGAERVELYRALLATFDKPAESRV